ncbi:MAG: hypothetical protein K0S65_4248, partial [Labilithrix sp.]|nr:hypothetical protein [Labilithrix sp.]
MGSAMSGVPPAGFAGAAVVVEAPGPTLADTPFGFFAVVGATATLEADVTGADGAGTGSATTTGADNAGAADVVAVAVAIAIALLARADGVRKRTPSTPPAASTSPAAAAKIHVVA